MAIPIHSGDHLHVVGNSLTTQGWYNPTGGLVDLINAQVPATTTRTFYAAAQPGSVAAVVRSGSATVGPVTVPKVFVQVTASGIPGTTSDEILADMNGRIFSFNPDVLIIEIGTNEHPGVNGWSVAKSQANLESIITQTRTWKPGIPIGILGLLTYSEQWAAGPVWSPIDTDTDSMVAMQQAVAGEFSGVTFMGIRSQALTYESTHNTPAPGATSGILTTDGRHPNTTGQVQIGNWTIGSFQVLP